MTQSEYEAELHFRLCKSIFATLAIRGIIAEDDIRILLCTAKAAFHHHSRDTHRSTAGTGSPESEVQSPRRSSHTPLG